MAKKVVKSDAPVVHDEWAAQDDARTLQRAQEIQSDGKRHNAAKAHAAKQIEQLSKVAGKPMPKAAKPAARSKKK